MLWSPSEAPTGLPVAKSHAEQLRHLKAPANRNLPPPHPPRTPPSQVLALGNQTLMNRAGEQCDAVPAHLITEVLTGHADPGGAGGSQDINIQVVPLLSGNGISGRHRSRASASVLLATVSRGQAGQKPPCRPLPGGSTPTVAQRPHGLLGCPAQEVAV
jgi:hypothetical protein